MFEFKNLTLEEQLELVSNIELIDNPCEEVQLEAVKQNSKSIQYINNPSVKARLSIAKRSDLTVEYIKNLYEELNREIVKNINSTNVDIIELYDFLKLTYNIEQDIKQILLNRILKDMDITPEECIELLKNNI